MVAWAMYVNTKSGRVHKKNTIRPRPDQEKVDWRQELEGA